jgi:uroporphyrinogen decarboxylase
VSARSTSARCGRTPDRDASDYLSFAADGSTQTSSQSLRALPVFVFAGAPFTVATCCTGKDMDATRAFARELPDVWEELLRRLSTATARFLSVLTAEGADAYQLFDSWAGMLTRDEYQRWAQPFHRDLFAAVSRVPRILFVKEGPYLDLMTASGADVISLGAHHDLAQARRDYPHLVLQGNVDEELLRTGTPDQVAEATRRCVAASGTSSTSVTVSIAPRRSPTSRPSSAPPAARD